MNAASGGDESEPETDGDRGSPPDPQPSDEGEQPDAGAPDAEALVDQTERSGPPEAQALIGEMEHADSAPEAADLLNEIDLTRPTPSDAIPLSGPTPANDDTDT